MNGRFAKNVWSEDGAFVTDIKSCKVSEDDDDTREGALGLGRNFLFLQGPHGPFFRELASAMRAEGASVLKVGVSKADDREWGGVGPYQAFTGRPAEWPTWIEQLMEERAISDIVVYGDTRGYHARALEIARAKGLTIHCFEEGYLRPFWVTYERGGVNGASRLMDFTVSKMAEASRVADYDLTPAPPIWGAAWRHAFHGFRHHADVMFANRAYPHYEAHRPTSLGREFMLYLKRLLVLPMLVPQRRVRERRLLKSGKLYHLVLLQMAIDSSMRDHSDYESVAAFALDCLEAFAVGAPRDHHLVFKAHPFEDGRERLAAYVAGQARRLGVEDRIVFLEGGKLGQLLDRARSAITVNSTAGQQALWRGLPLSVHGRAVYDKPEFCHHEDLISFFRRPVAPDAVAYREYRQFLLMTSQVRGGFYSAAGRRDAVEAAIEKIFDPLDPYDRLFQTAASKRAEASPDGKVAAFPLDVRKS